MAREKVAQSNDREPFLLISLEEAQKKIDSQVEKGQALLNSSIRNTEELRILQNKRQTWKEVAAELLKQVFSTPDKAVWFSRDIPRGPMTSVDLPSSQGEVRAFQHDLSEDLRKLDSIRQRLELLPITQQPKSDLMLRVLDIAERKLRKTIRKAPDSEKEVQDAFENLLIGGEIPHSREKEAIEYSSKTYIPDFTISKADLALDIKLCRRDGREKEIVAEINDDIGAYRTKFGNLLFVIYDVGKIRDADLFAESFEKHPGVVIRIVKH